MSNIILTQIPAVYVWILYHYQLNPSIVISTVKFTNEIINLFFHVVSFSLKVGLVQYYPIFHWLWNFWEMFSLISYLKYFSRMKRWWRKALQLPLPVTIKRNLSSRYKWKKLFERYMWPVTAYSVTRRSIQEKSANVKFVENLLEYLSIPYTNHLMPSLIYLQKSQMDTQTCT